MRDDRSFGALPPSADPEVNRAQAGIALARMVANSDASSEAEVTISLQTLRAIFTEHDAQYTDAFFASWACAVLLSCQDAPDPMHAIREAQAAIGSSERR